MKVSGQKIISQGESSSTDRSGVTTCTEATLYMPGTDPRGLALPKKGDSQVIRPNGDGSYTVENTTYTAGDGITTTEYSTCLTTEPIDTHPDFVGKIGGKLGSELNGALFNPTTGIFERFASTSKYAGITSYLCFSAARTETTVRKGTEADDTTGVGTVSGEWLCTGVNSSVQYGIVTTRVEWRQAGPRGWDSVIYGSST